MLPLDLNLDDPYVPFVSSRHSSVRVHEIRRLESHAGGARRYLGRALIRAGLAVAGLDAGSRR
jgi:hypothetical protein